jgi:hypothetical protein
VSLPSSTPRGLHPTALHSAVWVDDAVYVTNLKTLPHPPCPGLHGCCRVCNVSISLFQCQKIGSTTKCATFVGASKNHEIVYRIGIQLRSTKKLLETAKIQRPRKKKSMMLIQASNSFGLCFHRKPFSWTCQLRFQPVQSSMKSTANRVMHSHIFSMVHSMSEIHFRRGLKLYSRQC